MAAHRDGGRLIAADLQLHSELAEVCQGTQARLLNQMAREGATDQETSVDAQAGSRR